MNPAWVAAIVALVGILGGFFLWFARSAARIFIKFNQFIEDWNGSPADRGHSERPGVMERLARQEAATLDVKAQAHRNEALMSDVQAQVHMNGGGSLRDEVKRTEAAVESLAGDVSVVKDKVDDLTAAVDVLKARP